MKNTKWTERKASGIPTLKTFIVSTIFTLLVLSGFSKSCRAQDGSGSRSPESLTIKLADLNAQFQAAGQPQNSQLLNELQSVAITRQQVLAALVNSNPGEVLRVSLPPDVRASLPPSVQSAVEKEVEAEGSLEVQVEDGKSGAKLYHFLKTASERLALHFAGNPPASLLTGSIVRVRGVRVGNALALTSGTSTASSNLQTIAAASLPSTFGAFNTLVIMVNFQDNPTNQPYTSAAVQNVVFSQTSNWDMENSFQKTSLTGNVAGWYTIGVSSTNCDTGTIKADAQAAAQAAGYNLGSYNRFIYLMSRNTGCSSWWGWATIGGSDVWINGEYQLTTHVVAHEMGHNLGLYHSHTNDCGTAVLCSSGTFSEYGDWIDDMGAPSYTHDGHFDSFQKERLGWLNNGTQPSITTVSSSGTYVIGPYEAQDGNPKALKILQSNTSSGSSYYYVEYRQAMGADSFLSGYSDILGGVVVHLASPANSNSSKLLDMTPTSPSSFSHPGLVVGSSYTDSTAGVTIKPTAVNSTGATVAVTLAAAACTRANPTLTLSPSQSQWVTPGTTVSFTLNLVDHDSSNCGSSSFNLGASVPSGWSFALGSSMLTLSPGGNASTTLQVTSLGGAANGYYTVGAKADDASATQYTASASATYVVSTATTTTPSLSVGTNQSSYSPGQTVAITVTLLLGTSADAGAGTNVTVTTSDGKTTTLTGTTDSSGAASLSYKLSKHAAAGTYGVQATAAAAGNSASVMASITFNVQ
jgi:NPCBM-associated, NEW3 domain of alpha-galactosidase/Astacin (Peptidase family M12A)